MSLTREKIWAVARYRSEDNEKGHVATLTLVGLFNAYHDAELMLEQKMKSSKRTETSLDEYLVLPVRNIDKMEIADFLTADRAVCVSCERYIPTMITESAISYIPAGKEGTE